MKHRIKAESRYTSLKLAKLLRRCKLESDVIYMRYYDKQIPFLRRTGNVEKGDLKAYDIMNDICIRYKVEMFGYKSIEVGTIEYPDHEEAYVYHSKRILELLQDGDKSGAEKYLWSVCKFNPENNK